MMELVKYRFADSLKNNILILLITLFPLFLLLTYSIKIEIALSFFINTCLLSLLLWVILSINDNNLCNIFFIIFFYLFFIIAPIIQLSSEPLVFVNTLPYVHDLVFASNVITILFIATYIFTYSFLELNRSKFRFISPFNSFSEGNKQYKFVVLAILILLSILAVLFAIEEMRNKTSVIFLLESRGLVEDVSESLLKKKVLYNFPLAAFIYLISLPKFRYKGILVLFCILLIFVVKNPLLEKRNGLGATYLLLLYYFIEPYLNRTRSFFILFFGLVVVFFPLSSIFTHTTAFRWFSSLEYLSISEVILDHFVELHYDAWVNLAATIEYTQVYGYKYGYQLLGTLLFFFPRSQWSEKPDTTGKLIGDYLIDRHNMWFNNLSNPIQAEGYVDFGILGVIVYGVLLAVLSVLMGRLLLKKESIFKYASVYVACSYIFILRGALMASIAYTIGALISILLIPLLLNRFFRNIKFKW